MIRWRKRRVVVDPREQVVVADQLEEVHGEADIEISQPGTVPGIGVEGILAAQPHRQDVTKDVLQQLLLVEALPRGSRGGCAGAASPRPSRTARRN